MPPQTDQCEDIAELPKVSPGLGTTPRAEDSVSARWMEATGQGVGSTEPSIRKPHQKGTGMGCQTSKRNISQRTEGNVGHPPPRGSF